ncbi:MAG: hypothetical protein KIT62_13475 [Cyclobacteriaceae bacterium]|nr:hypothetical protein [Cyclobacteriaceae bacterium]
MKYCLSVVLFFSLAVTAYAQHIIVPDSATWSNIKEGATLQFTISTDDAHKPMFQLEGAKGLGIILDSIGNFSWTPAYTLVDRLEKQKEFSVIVQASWKDGRRVSRTLNFTVHHQNQAPVIEDLPVFYVKQSSANQYQIPNEYVSDPDGDPIIFRSVQSQMPEGAALSSQGLLTWSPSRSQFNALKNNPLTIEFIVQDQPEKAETKGKIRIAQTQLDLPPEMLIVPGDSVITIKEDDRVNLKIYISDPNGDDNIMSVSFISSDGRIEQSSLVQSTPTQAEFTWTPGYYFVQEIEKTKPVNIIFFALDKSNNRVQRKVSIVVKDTENMDEKHKFLYMKYRSSLVQAKALLDILDNNYDVLNKAYRKAKRGKKNRSLVNASLGATTGLSPVVLDTDPSKVVSAVGGTTVLTLGTLEATEVLGKSKNDIMDRLKINVEIRNQLQLEGDNFARKYALKSTRLDEKTFNSDRDKLLPIINNQKLITLELDANKATPNYTVQQMKKTFPDFAEE